MEESTQTLFTKSINGDSLLQIKDGRILCYHFRGSIELTVYEEKSFDELFTIDFLELMEKSEKPTESKEIIEDEENNYQKLKQIYKERIDKCEKCTVKELLNSLILVGATNYLFELKLHEKTYDYKIIAKLEDCILEINELSDNRIIVITKSYINLINREKNEYIIKDKYPIKDIWKIVALSSRYRFFGKFKQYFSSYELPKNRLLLNSFSTELSYNGGCGTHPPSEFSHSKVIFIDLKNFEEIKSTDVFKIDAKSIILEEVIVIQAYKDIYIYDINSLDIINKIKFNTSYDYLYKYNNQTIIAISERERYNNLFIYKIDNNNLIKNCEIKTKFAFQESYGINHYVVRGYNNKTLFVLNDKRVVMICHNKIYILSLEID